jgi:hypothetical protein
MTIDKNTIKTMNNKVATHVRTVSATQSLRDEINAQVQAFIDAGGYVQEVENTLDDHLGDNRLAGMGGMGNDLGISV